MWDSDINKSSKLANDEIYIGPSIEDVFGDFKENHPILNFFGINPVMNERNLWPREITAVQDKNSFGANWTHLANGKPGERALYNFFNGLNTVGDIISGESVSDGSMRNLDGTATTTDQGILGLYSTASTFAPLKTPTFTRTGSGFRALSEEYAESTIANGFYRSGNAGRLGNDGIYI